MARRFINMAADGDADAVVIRINDQDEGIRIHRVVNIRIPQQAQSGGRRKRKKTKRKRTKRKKTKRKKTRKRKKTKRKRKKRKKTKRRKKRKR